MFYLFWLFTKKCKVNYTMSNNFITITGNSVLFGGNQVAITTDATTGDFQVVAAGKSAATTIPNLFSSNACIAIGNSNPTCLLQVGSNNFVATGSNVGINTVTPRATFDVVGDINFTGNLTHNGGAIDTIYSSQSNFSTRDAASNVVLSATDNLSILTDVFGASVGGQPTGVDWLGRVSTSLANDTALHVSSDSAGNVYVSGYYAQGAAPTVFNADGSTSSVTLPTSALSGNYIAFSIRYNSLGFAQWSFAVNVSLTGQHARVYHAGTDSSGFTYLAGSYNQTATFFNTGATRTSVGTSSNTVYVVKLDASGTLQWYWAANAASGTHTRDARVDGSGNVIVAFGYSFNLVNVYENSTSVNNTFGLRAPTNTNSSVCGIAKISAAGATLWMKSTEHSTSSNNDAMFCAVDIDPAGDVFWAVNKPANGMTLFNGNRGTNTADSMNTVLSTATATTGHSIAIFKLNGSTGACQSFFVADNDRANKYNPTSIVVDASSNVYLGMYANIAISGVLSTLTFKTFNTGTGAVVTSISAGTIPSGAYGNYLLKFNSSGLIWSRPASGPDKIFVDNLFNDILVHPTTFDVWTAGYYTTTTPLPITGGGLTVTLPVSTSHSRTYLRWTSGGAISLALNATAMSGSLNAEVGATINMTPSGNIIIGGSYSTGSVLTSINTSGTSTNLYTFPTSASSDAFVAVMGMSSTTAVIPQTYALSNVAPNTIPHGFLKTIINNSTLSTTVTVFNPSGTSILSVPSRQTRNFVFSSNNGWIDQSQTMQSFSNLTQGRVVFASTPSNIITASGLTWDSTNGFLGVGTSSPANAIDVSGQIRASGLITGQNGLTISSGATSLQAANATTVTASGLITGQNGLTVSAGTTTLQAANATTVTASGLITGQNGLTVSAGTTTLQATNATSVTTPTVTVSNVSASNINARAMVVSNVTTSSLTASNLQVSFNSIIERAYPPAAMTGNTTNISGQSYGNGSYIASAAVNTWFYATTPPWKVFDTVLNTTTTDVNNFYHVNADQGGTIYAFDMFSFSAPFAFNTTKYTQASYPRHYMTAVTSSGSINIVGDWLQLQMPTAVPINRVSLTSRENNAPRMIGSGFILGSTNGTTWAVIGTLTNETWNNSIAETKTYTTTDSTPYSYVRLVATNLAGSGAIWNIVEFGIISQEAQPGNALNVTGPSVLNGVVTVSNNLNVTGNTSINGNLSCANLTVQGTTTTVNSTTVNLQDNIININSGQTGTPLSSLIGGIEVNRGALSNYQFVFEEASRFFKVGTLGGLQAVATRRDAIPNATVPYWNNVTNQYDFNSNVVVNSSGFLGVGKSNPAYVVDVSGDINFSGNLLRNGVVFGQTTSIQYTTSNAITTTIDNIANVTNLVASNTQSMVDWTATVDGAGVDDTCTESTFDPRDGSVYVCGIHSSPTDCRIFNRDGTNSGLTFPTDMIAPTGYCVKYNSQGFAQWVVVMESGATPSEDRVTRVAVDASGFVYIAGSYGKNTTGKFYSASNKVTPAATLPSTVNNAVFLIKLTSTGEHVWNASLESGTDCFGYVSVDRPTGDVYFYGQYGGDTATIRENGVAKTGNPWNLVGLGNTGRFAGFLIKFSSAGVAQWARAFVAGTTTWVAIYNVQVDASGFAYALGFSGGDNTQTTIWNPPGTYTGANQQVPATATGGPFITRFDPSGVPIYSTAFLRSTGRVDSNGFSLDASGNIYVAGSYTGTLSFVNLSGTPSVTMPASPTVWNGYVAKLTNAGNWLWINQIISNTSNFNVVQLAVDASQNVYVSTNYNASAIQTQTGTTGTTLSFPVVTAQAAALISYTTNGAIQWGYLIDGASPESSLYVSYNPVSNKFVWTGQYAGSPTTRFITPSGTSTFSLHLTTTTNAGFALQFGAGMPTFTLANTPAASNGLVKLLTNASAFNLPVTAGSNSIVLQPNRTAEYIYTSNAWQPLTRQVAASDITSGVVSTTVGGTGTSNLPAGNVLVGNSSNAVLTSSNLFWDNVNARLGVGINTPSFPLHVNGSAVSGSNNVSIFASHDIAAFSDARKKTALAPITSALDKVSQLTGYTFERIDTPNGKRMAGVLAQEVEKVLPEVVNSDQEGYLNVSYGNMVGLLINAIKELKTEVDELKPKPNA